MGRSGRDQNRPLFGTVLPLVAVFGGHPLSPQCDRVSAIALYASAEVSIQTSNASAGAQSSRPEPTRSMITAGPVVRLAPP